jgi:cell shape-determining protein MreC
MTIFGKLLVFLNLVFSIATGALIVFVFTTRANWVAAYKDAEAKVKTAEQAYKSEKAAHENDLRQKEAEMAGQKEQVKQLTTAVETAQQEARSARELATKNEGLSATGQASQAKLQAELAQIREERDGLVKQQNELRARIVSIQQELDKQVEKAVLADLRARNMEQKASNLLRQVEELTVRNRELEANPLAPGGGGGRTVEEGTTTAPAGVRGKVTDVGTNLAQIDIGSDSGLSQGNSLVVYRGNEWVGDLTLTRVEAKQAVGKFTPARRGAEVKKGDLVITSFTGGGRDRP